jgi:hypothetical protein
MSHSITACSAMQPVLAAPDAQNAAINKPRPHAQHTISRIATQRHHTVAGHLLLQSLLNSTWRIYKEEAHYAACMSYIYSASTEHPHAAPLFILACTAHRHTTLCWINVTPRPHPSPASVWASDWASDFSHNCRIHIVSKCNDCAAMLISRVAACYTAT